MTIVSAALRRRVYIDRDAYKIYPNLYTFLIAESASCKKSVAMELGLDLLGQNEDIKIVHERTTLEGLLDLMNRAEITPQQRVRPDGSVMLHADELSNLFGKATYITDLVSFLTAAYTAKAKLDFLTRNKGFVRVRNPCPVILAGTTPEQMGEIFPSMTLSSGFMGRVLLVTASEGKRVAKPRLVAKLREPLIEDLYQISQLDGEVKLTEELDEHFTTWYEVDLPEVPPKEAAPFFYRKHDHILKAAMLLSIAESDKMIVNVDHFAQAEDAINLLEGTISHAVRHIGATPESDIGDAIVSVIKKSHPEAVSHTTLLNRFYKKIPDATKFGAIIDTLLNSDQIVVNPRTKGIYYQLGKGEKRDEIQTPDIRRSGRDKRSPKS